MANRVHVERDESASGCPSKLLGEQQHQQRTDHEYRHRKLKARHSRQNAIRGRAGPARHIGAEWQSDRDGERGGGENQLDRPRKARRDLVSDRIVVKERAPEIALKDAADE